MSKINAEVITIGDEILIGQITDTNTQYISTELNKIGIKTTRKISVGDQKEEITSILKEANGRAKIVIITGGLGPTKDDITKKTLAEYFNDTLILNQQAETFIKTMFESRGFEFTEINRQQAYIPSKATYLHNNLGTAPGMWLEKDGTVFISLPGVPYEMKNLIQQEVLPRLIKKFKTPVLLHKTIRTIGIGESTLSETIANWEDQLPENIKLAYLPSFGQVRLRLSGEEVGDINIENQIETEVKKVLPLIEKYVFSLTNEDLEEAIGRLLLERKATLATAESCTGGYVGHLLTSVAGSSAYYNGGIIAYSNKIKTDILGVSEKTLENHGAVSEETVLEMAEGVRKKFNATFGIATSGIAGPGGGTELKPVGTICIAVSSKDETISKKIRFTKKRDTNIKYSSVAVLNLLRILLIEHGRN